MIFWISIGLTWLLFACIAGWVADVCGGEGYLGFLLGLLFGPFGIIAAYYLGDETMKEEGLIKAGERKRCPACSELVKPQAIICKHCAHDFTALHLHAKDAA